MNRPRRITIEITQRELDVIVYALNACEYYDVPEPVIALADQLVTRLGTIDAGAPATT